MKDLESVSLPQKWMFDPPPKEHELIEGKIFHITFEFLGKLRGAYTIAHKLAALNYYFTSFKQFSVDLEGQLQKAKLIQLSSSVYHFALKLDVADEEIYDGIWEGCKLPDLSGEKPPQVGKLAG